MPRLLHAFEACFMLLIDLSRYKVLDTRYPLLVTRYSCAVLLDKLENTLEVFISFVVRS